MYEHESPRHLYIREYSITPAILAVEEAMGSRTYDNVGRQLEFGAFGWRRHFWQDCLSRQARSRSKRSPPYRSLLVRN